MNPEKKISLLKICLHLSYFLHRQKTTTHFGFYFLTKIDKSVNAPRVVQAENVHNITHYIDVISGCTPSDAVSNLCDRFR